MSFEDIKSSSARKVQFTLANTAYPYANTLRRSIMTLVSGVAFRSDPPGIVSDNSDIKVLQNDSNTQPNELLAHRISLLPMHGVDPDTFDSDRYVFKIDIENTSASPIDVTASDIKVYERRKAADLSETLIEIPGKDFFIPHPLTRETCLITSMPAKRSSLVPTLKVEMRATVGLGREHARFIPTCQSSYGYTLDTNTERRNAYFEKWLITHKNVEPESLKQDDKRRGELDREFKTMQIQRIYKVDEKGDPNSFDFQIESIGPMAPRAIIERALIGLVKLCEPFIGLDNGDLPPTISVTPSDSQMPGFDFLIKGEDHTFGNMIQTWLVDNHVDGDATPRISFAGYKIPHPLKDEMLLRIGVEDGNEVTARTALAMSARGCRAMFQEWLRLWTGGAPKAAPGTAAPGTAAAERTKLKLKTKMPSVAQAAQ
uniref:DNA-directed RNA polymerase RpoA/D/Rpb3-type domain-containing protein n=1 Tax=viral metagenome TaxID=1070528 RepID=A0A6C0DM71_9ZZZZ